MFKLVKVLNGRTNQPEPVRLPAKAEGSALHFAEGSVLKLSGGKLANCGATDKPMYLCAEDRTLAPGTSCMLSVFPLTSDMVLEAPTADAAALLVGGMYTLAQTTYAETGTSYASGVTATATNGVVRIFDKVDPAGDGKRVRVTIPA